MRRIITFGCTIGGIILGGIIFMIMLGAGYKELIGLTILQVVYMIGFCAVIIVYGTKTLMENKNNEKIPIKIEKKEENINYIVKNDDMDYI